MRLTILLPLAAALPWSTTRAADVVYDAPLLPPPSFAQAASVEESVVQFAGGGDAYDAPVLPPPSLVRVVVPSRPAVALAASPINAAPRAVSLVRAATHATEAAFEELPPADTPIAWANEPVWANESTCLSAGCAPCQGYPSCGDRANCPRFWFASAEATFLGVRAETGGQAVVSYDSSAFPGVELAASAGEGLDGFSVAPRLTLGYQFGPLWAVAGRFWTLSDSVNSTPAVTPGVDNLNAFFVSEHVRTDLDAVDLEAVRSFTPGLWKLDAAVGVRHASIGTSTHMEAFADFDGSVAIQSILASDTRFDGTGPTVALTGRRRLGGTPAFLFLGGRSSMLWGSADARARVNSVLTTPTDAFPGLAEGFQPGEDPMLWIGEASLGVQWELPLAAIPATAFFRTAVEYQYWIVDTSNLGNSVQPPPPPPPAPGGFSVLSSIGAGNAGAHVYGAAIAAGFTW